MLGSYPVQKANSNEASLNTIVLDVCYLYIKL